MVWRPGQLSYRIEFVRSSAMAYSRLDPLLQRRVDRELSRLSETPRHAGVIRLQSDDELYRVRIGDLRLLFCVEDQVLLVLIVKIGHRGSVYRA
jgi:mRNA interferase RelE/StbE